MSHAHVIDLATTMSYAAGIAVGYRLTTRWYHAVLYTAVFGALQLVPL